MDIEIFGFLFSPLVSLMIGCTMSTGMAYVLYCTKLLPAE